VERSARRASAPAAAHGYGVFELLKWALLLASFAEFIAAVADVAAPEPRAERRVAALRFPPGRAPTGSNGIHFPPTW
jgi:hypothetical protein